MQIHIRLKIKNCWSSQVYPADFIAEGVDQINGLFFTSVRADGIFDSVHKAKRSF